MKTRLEEMTEQCQEFHNKHPEVWDLFVKFTFEMINKGYKHYAVVAIFERIRWEMDLGGDGTDTFKLNNNYRSLYSRRFMRAYPQHEGFFRTRKQTSEDCSATDLSELKPTDYEYL